MTAQRPLAPARIEQTMAGALQAAAGVVLVAVAVARGAAAVPAVLVAAIGAAVFATAAWFGARRLLDAALRDPPPLPAGGVREPPRATALRSLLFSAPIVAVAALLAITGGGVSVVPGIVLGGGVTFLLAAARVGRYERETGRTVFRAPHVRWSRGAWALFDAGDFYASGAD